MTDADDITNWLKFANWVVSLPRVVPEVPAVPVSKSQVVNHQGFRDVNPGKPVTSSRKRKRSLRSRVRRFFRSRVYRLKKTLRRYKRKFVRLCKPSGRSGRRYTRVAPSGSRRGKGETSPRTEGVAADPDGVACCRKTAEKVGCSRA